MSTTIGGIRIEDMPDLGTFTSDSSIVGEHGGSGRFSASALSSYFLPISGGTVTGDTNFYSTDWQAALVSWPSTASHVQVLSPDGRMALTGASDTAHSGGVTYPVAIGVSGFGFANLTGTFTTGSNGQAWGGYFESRIYPGVNSCAWGIEVDVCNVSGTASGFLTPYVKPSAISVGINLASGGGVASDTPPLTAYASTAGIYFQNNGGPFNTGIVFAHDAITLSGGTTGTGTAIALATGHVMQWTMADNTPGPAIYSIQSTGQPAQLVFDNHTAYLRNGPTATPLLGVDTTALSTTGTTSVSLCAVNNAGASYIQVSLGAPDSGGTGFRVLRVPN